MRARLISALLRLFAALPLRWSQRIAVLPGWLLAHLPNGLRRITEINLGVCFPELSAAERRTLTYRSLVETCRTAFEIGPMWLWPAPRLLEMVTETRDAELVDSALKSGQGVILATPHLGCWEIAGHYCAARWHITSLYRPPRIKALDELIRQGRARCGAQLVRTDAKGVRQLFQTLNSGGVIGILPDQDPGDSGGVFAPFFGTAANSMVLLPRLARKTGAKVFFVRCERLPGAAGYRLHFTAAEAQIQDADAQVAAAAMNRSVEACVRACPEQYQWSYRRFRTRPPGKERIY